MPQKLNIKILLLREDIHKIIDTIYDKLHSVKEEFEQAHPEITVTESDRADVDDTCSKVIVARMTQAGDVVPSHIELMLTLLMRDIVEDMIQNKLDEQAAKN